MADENNIPEEQGIEIEPGWQHTRLLDREIEDGDNIYRPYTIYYSKELYPHPEKENTFQEFKQCDIHFNDEIIEPFHYTDLIETLHHLSRIVDCIRIFISCPGGDISTLQVLLNTIEEIKNCCYVETVVHGQACSAAAILALAGDDCIFGDFSYLMFHNISLSSGSQREHGKLKKSMKLMQSVYRAMLEKYAAKILTKKEISDILENDGELYLEADEVRKRYHQWEKKQSKKEN